MSTRLGETERQTDVVGAVGRPLLRKEDRPLLVGGACFVDDLHRPGELHANVVRSPFAHARLGLIDAREARALEGVHAVFTADDLPGEPLIPIRMAAQPGLERALQPPLARGRVRYAGEPVALVVADSRYLAEDAAELVLVDYEPLDPVLDAEAALAPETAPLHDGMDSNLAGELALEFGDVEGAFAAADLVVEERFVTNRHGAVPLEPRGVVAEPDPATGGLTVWGAAKIPHLNREILAGLLDLPEEQIRLVELHVGGSFGARGEFYPEDYLIPWCALRLDGPVKWVEDREESLRTLNHAREQLHEVALAVAADGTFLALRDRFVTDTGAYVRTHGVLVPILTAELLTGPYRFAAYRCELVQALTTKTPCGTYRAPGRFESNFVRERLVDVAARRLGRDPVDLRRQNLVRPDEMPYRNGVAVLGHPVVFDSGDYPLLLDKTLERLDHEGLRRWRDGDPGSGRRRGLGLAYSLEHSGVGVWEYARVELDSRGKTVVFSGGASVGQGIETTLAQICADGLGVPYEDVSVVHGDTARVPDGIGAYGSRVTVLGGSAVGEAAGALRRRILERASRELEVAPEDLEIAGDRVVVRGTQWRSITLGELRERARPAAALAAGAEPGLSEEAYFRCEALAYGYTVHCAAVEVDVETGAVTVARYGIGFDVGRAVNPLLVEGQVVGAAVQGLGGTLFEEFVYDADGQLVSGSLADYLLPTAPDVPRIDVLLTEDAASPHNPLGLKGAGEAGNAAVGAAVANAVADALGAQPTRLPLTPERVRRLATTTASGTGAREESA